MQAKHFWNPLYQFIKVVLWTYGEAEKNIKIIFHGESIIFEVKPFIPNFHRYAIAEGN